VPAAAPGAGPPAVEIDPCLKRPNRQRVCATNRAAGGPGFTVNFHDNGRSVPGGDGFVQFIVVSTSLPAATVAYTSPAGRTAIALDQVPGANLRAAVLFPGGLEAAPPCRPGSGGGLELLDASGAFVACLS
jgi:hypothetical protein